MTPWQGGPPKNFEELYAFYYDYVKGLYSECTANSTLPNETLFEINAAFDHISRKWKYGESEEQVVSKAYSHLKRSYLDLFKMYLDDTNRDIEDLRQVDTTLIDNGAYHRDLLSLQHRIREEATRARSMEGMTDEDDVIPAFNVWSQVYADCHVMRSNFLLHPGVDWAKRTEDDKERRRSTRDFWRGVLAGVIGSLIVAALLAGLQMAVSSWGRAHVAHVAPAKPTTAPPGKAITPNVVPPAKPLRPSVPGPHPNGTS